MDYRREHVHVYSGSTSTDMGHHHTFRDLTGTAQFTNGSHVHNYATETSVAENHSHSMTGTSGTQLRAPLGHVHRLQGLTSYAHGHAHSYDVYTGRPRSARRAHATGSKKKPPEESPKPDGNETSGL